MKIRTGFISNSSSSSFILVGYKLTEEEAEHVFKTNNINTEDGFYEDLEELMRVLSEKLNHKIHYIAGEGIDGALIGLGRDLDECSGNEEIDLNHEEEFFNTLYFNLFYNIQNQKPSVYSGTRMC